MMGQFPARQTQHSCPKVTMEISGIIVLLVTIVLSRILNERALRELSPDEKVRLIDGFASARAYSLIPLVVLVGVYWLLLTKTKLDPQLVSVLYFGLIFAWIMVRTYLNQRKLRELEMPATYRQRFLVSQAISLVGFAWFFYTFFGEMAR
jgi:hypothetical protein